MWGHNNVLRGGTRTPVLQCLMRSDLLSFQKDGFAMQLSSSRSDRAATPGSLEPASVESHQPVVLGERSLALMALVRIFFGLLWFQQLAWKMPPTFGGLHRYVENEAQHTFV